VLAAVGTWWGVRSAAKLASAKESPVVDTPQAAPAGAPVAERSEKPEVKPTAVEPAKRVADERVLLAAKPETAADMEPNHPQSAPSDPTATRASSDTRTGNQAIEAARKLMDGGQAIEARHQLNALLKTDLGETASAEVRALLTRLADDTIFGRRSMPNDPLVESYTVQAGDVLLNIAKNYDVPYEALMLVNGIADATKIREGQKLKVPRGPFHVKICKSKFRMDVYLQDVYVRSFRVGLGTENGTPEGVWKVKNRLENPTYYPPASATDKRIIPPDDPNNPLGKRWIGLEGVEGDALGHEGYGIHGTIEPESIGKAVSLGCIRMHNEDVGVLYNLLMPGRTTVTILP
jgi:LysM repeat protein